MRARAFLTFAILAFGAAEGPAQQQVPVDSIETRVWLDRGDEPVVQRGDDVRVYYRTSEDAFAAIFRIDTDGVISLLFPHHPDAHEVIRGGRDYRLLFPRSPRWRVDEDPGVGYFFMVASPDPLDFSAFGYDEDGGWELGEVGATVYEDPYVAIDDYVAAIVPEWEFVPYALDFLTYNVGDTHSYPRFLCYDCHGFRSYSAWNPYSDPCASYQVVIWDDPYFYPRYRYVGTRVVFARPLVARPRYGVTARVAGAGWAPVVKRRVAPPSRVVEYKESPRPPSYQPRNPAPRRSTGPVTRLPSTRSALPNRTRPTTTARGANDVTLPRATRAVSPPRAAQTAPPRRAAGTPSRGPAGTTSRPTLQRRPSSPSARLPGRATTSTRGTTSRGTTSRGTTSRGTTSRRPATAALGRGGSPNRAVGVAPRAPPSRAVPRSGVSGRRPPAAQRPSAGSRSPTSGRSDARPSTQRRPARARPTPTRRPGGRGRGGA